jgi:hypothetical protein
MKRPDTQWPTALTGALEHVGITSVLMLLEMERRTGILELRYGRRAGLLSVREGRIVNATLNRRPLPRCDALCELVRWTNGQFVFRVGEVELSGDEAAPLPTAQLLLEVARRADERRRMVA